MTASQSSKIAPTGDTLLRKIIHALNRLIEGRGDNYKSEVTLTAGATTTTVLAQFVSSNSTIVLSPRTANAAAALATTYVSAKADGSFELTHANNGQTDRTFDIAWIG